MINDSKVVCPLDNKEQKETILADFPINYALMNYVKMTKRKCQEHKRELSLVCRQCQRTICEECKSEHAAKNHSVIGLPQWIRGYREKLGEFVAGIDLKQFN